MLGSLFNMLSSTANAHPPADDEAVADADEPPDDRRPDPKFYAKAKLAIPEAKKESLLTRALLSSPDLSPVEQSHMPPLSGRLNGPAAHHDQGNHSALSTAELTSDGGTTRSHTPSPPHPTQVACLPPTVTHEKPQHQTSGEQTPESELEANLGRKRCIKFACGRKPSADDGSKTMSDPMKNPRRESPAGKRKSALTFVCPTPPSRAPAGDDNDNKTSKQQPPVRRPSTSAGARGTSAERGRPKPNSEVVATSHANPVSQKPSKHASISVGGLGDFEPSEVTRFHEFGSSVEEEEDWVNEVTQHKPKITLNDCMKKENAIRRLGEEVEAEVNRDEDGDDNVEEDEDDDEEDDDDYDDDSDDDGDRDLFEHEDDDDGDEVETVHNDLSDDGNESDNEAGFASDDDSSDAGSEYNFWTPAMATAATSIDHTVSVQQSPKRTLSDSSLELGGDKDTTPLARRKQSAVPKSANAGKVRSGTPSLPDSTDFVCGTLDEDRPLEAAYKSRVEERRRSKYVTLPQDIDPSFPTSDPEDEEDDDDDDDDDKPETHATKNRVQETLNAFEFRGRTKGGSSQTSPNQSPSSRHPSPGRKVHGRSPRRLRSPPPAPRHKSPPRPQHRRPSGPVARPSRGTGINITGLAQRHTRNRTGSLPRTPNPFFARVDQSRRPSKISVNKAAADRAHTRGAVDIVAGLEKKRQKRKEKFWRQHCRKVAKEQQERKKPLPGQGAERMKELGLEVAERFRAYGFGQEAQLVISI